MGLLRSSVIGHGDAYVVVSCQTLSGGHLLSLVAGENLVLTKITRGCERMGEQKLRIFCVCVYNLSSGVADVLPDGVSQLLVRHP